MASGCQREKRGGCDWPAQALINGLVAVAPYLRECGAIESLTICASRRRRIGHNPDSTPASAVARFDMRPESSELESAPPEGATLLGHSTTLRSVSVAAEHEAWSSTASRIAISPVTQ